MGEVPVLDDCTVSVRFRENMFLRVRNSVGFHVLEHYSVYIMDCAWVDSAIRLKCMVRNIV